MLHLYFLVSKLTGSLEDSQFSAQMVLKIVNTYVLVFCVVSLWSGQSEFMALFMDFNIWIGPGFNFKCCS